MKRVPNMGDLSQVLQKIHFDSLTSKRTQTIQFQYLNIFQIQIWYKSLFLLFFSFSLRERSPNSNDRERKILLTPIYAIKINDICVK